MRCSKCASDNREGRKFCAACGAPLVVTCPMCDATNHLGERFCGECGTALSEAAAAADTAPITTSASGERRHLTVLFCDLVGSTEIATRLDPEEWREIVAGYHRAAAQAIERFGGYVAQYQGDGVMAYFGYPEAHDNDGERAARAGLAILDAVSKQSQRPLGPELSARIGIDSGAVVVGASAGKNADVFGDTPNVAARVQAASLPGTVLITANTHRLISGLFVVEDCGAQSLKGIPRPIGLYRVIQPSGVRGRLEAAAVSHGLTPFVGREEELRLLLSRWERAVGGEGQVALIIGEAGIGKSRLVQRFHQQIAERPHTWVEAAAAAFFQNTPFYPVADMLQQFLSGDGDKSAEAQLARLESRLELAGLKPTEAIPLIAPLLSLPLTAKHPPSPLSPEQQRRRLLASLVEWVLGAARAQPLVIATEDLHWADPSTLELIQLLVEQAATRLLLLYTARPEFRPLWPLRAHHIQITLNRLSARDIRTMVQEVAAHKALSNEIIATVVERTGGVPLFVEELTRTVIESGSVKSGGREIPVTLHDSLMARLDRLGRAKEVAQLAAVIGSNFSYELLEAISSGPANELQAALAKLADAELIYARGIPPEATYQFKHALIRDAAYEALLKSRRRKLHRLVAHTIDEQFPDMKVAHPEVLARHWTEAGEIKPAMAEWQRAGKAAEERNAFREAEAHYREAVAMLLTLPDSPERDSRELILQMALGGIMVATRGWAALDTSAVYERARILAQKADVAVSSDLLFGLWITTITRGELRVALMLAHQVFEWAHNSHQALVGAYFAQGSTRLVFGELTLARQDLLEAKEHYREEHQHVGNVSEDRVVYSIAYAGVSEWLLGYPDRARRYTDEARALARRLNRPFALVHANGFGLTDVFRCDLVDARDACQEAERLSTELGFPTYRVISRIIGTWASARMGEARINAASMRTLREDWEAWGQPLFREFILSVLAEMEALAGAIDSALVTVEQALDGNPDELWCRPLTLQLRGELQLRSTAGNATRFELAERDFGDAIELARKMSAKSPELRATTSFARLLHDRGRHAEARSMLADIYNWFTEGFDTADLKGAKALLDELAT